MDHHSYIHTTIQPPPSQQEQQPDKERHARTPYRTIQCYIPPYLQSYVYPCGTTTVTNTDGDDDDDEISKENGMVEEEEEERDSDFCYTLYHQHPRLIAQLSPTGSSTSSTTTTTWSRTFVYMAASWTGRIGLANNAIDRLYVLGQG
jgi:hypothetical protein